MTAPASPAVAVLQGGPCPDCEAEGLCHWWCPRYNEPAYDDEDAQPEEEPA